MRIALMVIRKLYLVPFLFFKLWRTGKKYNGDYMSGFLQSKTISTHAIQAGNITVETHGIENIPEEDGFIFYPNHQGLFDVLTFFYSSPKPFAFVIKKEAKNNYNKNYYQTHKDYFKAKAKEYYEEKKKNENK